MAKRPQPPFIFIEDRKQKKLLKRTYKVICNEKVIGHVIYFWISHLEMVGWEAIGHDGHRAVHKKRIQAAKALLWDGKLPCPLYLREKVTNVE